MKYLSIFSPAETLLILKGKKASIKELLKATFIDLLLKRVLEITTAAKESSNSERGSYKYIIRGKKFHKHQVAKHETVYLSPYQKSKSIKILFQHLIRMGIQNARSERKFIAAVRQSPNINNYFRQNIIQLIFGGFSLTPDGMVLRNEISSEIGQLEQELSQAIGSGKEKTTHLLNTIGGNILLLNNIELSLLKEIDKEILVEISRRYIDAEGNMYYGCSSWDSGCTGCNTVSSGCSGCSGCGGGCSGD